MFKCITVSAVVGTTTHAYTLPTTVRCSITPCLCNRSRLRLLFCDLLPVFGGPLTHLDAQIGPFQHLPNQSEQSIFVLRHEEARQEREDRFKIGLRACKVI